MEASTCKRLFTERRGACARPAVSPQAAPGDRCAEPTRPCSRAPCGLGHRAAPGRVQCSPSRQGTRGCPAPTPPASSTRRRTAGLCCLQLNTHEASAEPAAVPRPRRQPRPPRATPFASPLPTRHPQGSEAGPAETRGRHAQGPSSCFKTSSWFGNHHSVSEKM